MLSAPPALSPPAPRRHDDLIQMLAARLFQRVPRARVQEDLERLGVREGDALLALVSLRSVGWVVGGAAAFADALLGAVGSEGAVMVPSFAALDPLPAPPEDGVFDEAATPSAAGRVSEAIRRNEGAGRSLHPVGSMAAVGPRAGGWLAGHEDHTAPFEQDTPLDRFVTCGGRVLLVGTHAGPLLPYLQERAGFPNLYRAAPSEILVRSRRGPARKVAVRTFRSSSCQVVILQGERPETRDYVLIRDYALVFPPERERRVLAGGFLRQNAGRLLGRLDRFRQRGVIRVGTVGCAPAALIEAREFCEQVGADLRWEVDRFKEDYDPEILENLALS